MERRTKPNDISQPTPRVKAILRMLSIAQLIRRQGTPDAAAEALECEKWLQNRLEVAERGEVARAA